MWRLNTQADADRAAAAGNVLGRQLETSLQSSLRPSVRGAKAGPPAYSLSQLYHCMSLFPGLQYLLLVQSFWYCIACNGAAVTKEPELAQQLALSCGNDSQSATGRGQAGF